MFKIANIKEEPSKKGEYIYSFVYIAKNGVTDICKIKKNGSWEKEKIELSFGYYNPFHPFNGTQDFIDAVREAVEKNIGQ